MLHGQDVKFQCSHTCPSFLFQLPSFAPCSGSPSSCLRGVGNFLWFLFEHAKNPTTMLPVESTIHTVTSNAGRYYWAVEGDNCFPGAGCALSDSICCGVRSLVRVFTLNSNSFRTYCLEEHEAGSNFIFPLVNEQFCQYHVLDNLFFPFLI